MLVNAVFSALSSLRHRPLMGLLLLCVLADAVILMLFIAAIFYGVQDFSLFGWEIPEWLLTSIKGVGATLLGWFLFPALMPVIAGFFADRIAGIIEKNEYPSALQTATSSFWADLFYDLRFVLKALLLNLLCLPLYLIPVVNLFVYYPLNAYLLGREFFEMAARRKMSLPQVITLRKAHSMTIISAGFLITLAANIPFINLVVPFFAIALMVHLTQKLT